MGLGAPFIYHRARTARDAPWALFLPVTHLAITESNRVPIVIESPFGAAGEPPGLREEAEGGAKPDLVIGVVNNMPDSALLGTERQFRHLLASSSGERRLAVRFACLNGIARAGQIQKHVAEKYWRLERLLESGLDALIVTGTEPRAAVLEHEPYWPSFCELLDYAETNLVSSLWSCLAAHAAVWRMDRIERHRLTHKRSGVYDFSTQTASPLTTDLPRHVPVPHSRWNEVRFKDLVEAGYDVLTVAENLDVDSFMVRRRSLLVFCQGHPEYLEDTLLREYRRDLGRFLTGENDRFPDIPHGYLSAESSSALKSFADLAASQRSSTRIEDFPYESALAAVDKRWSQPAVRFYENWLRCIEAEIGSRTVRERREATS